MKNVALLLFAAMLSMQIVSLVASGEFKSAAECVINRVTHFFSDSDIEDLSLNYNQIKQLISSFSSKNLVKAVNFAIQSTEMSRK